MTSEDAVRSYRSVEAEVIDPGALSPVQRDAVAHRLFTVQQGIFAGISAEQFADELFPPEAMRTRIQVYRSEQGHLVGYCAIHIYEIERRKKPLGILRVEAGLLADYRGASMTLWFGAKEALRYKALHPFRRFALFAFLVHPSGYHLLSRHFWKSYPYPGRRIPERWRAVLFHLAKSSGYEAVDRLKPLVRKVGWITRDSATESTAWYSDPRTDVQFYLSMNPDYGYGHGLAFIVPLSASNLLMSLLRYTWHLTVQRLHRR